MIQLSVNKSTICRLAHGLMTNHVIYGYDLTCFDVKKNIV